MIQTTLHNVSIIIISVFLNLFPDFTSEIVEFFYSKNVNGKFDDLAALQQNPSLNKLVSRRKKISKCGVKFPNEVK